MDLERCLSGKPLQHRSLAYIASLSIGFAGLQAAFAVQFATVTSTFLSFGLSPTYCSLLWLIPPTCGALFQPLFGRASDSCRLPYGRRRPFILAGSIAIVISLFGYAWCQTLAQVLSRSSDSFPQLGLSAIFGQFFFITLNIAIQPTQSSLRALVTDTCSKEQQAEANAWVSRITQITNVLLYSMAYSSSSKDPDNEGVKKMVIFASFIVVLAISITLLGVEEGPLSAIPNASDPPTTVHAPTRQLPLNVKLLYGAQFFSWFAWFPVLSNIDSYVNALSEQTVSTMKPASPFSSSSNTTFKRAGALALLVMAATALLFSLLLPKACSQTYPNESKQAKRLCSGPYFNGFDISFPSLSIIWLISQFMFAFAISTLLIFRTIRGTILAMIPLGFCWSVTQWVPFTLINLEIIDAGLIDGIGTVIGLHNTFISLPQILASAMNGLILQGVQNMEHTAPGVSLLWTFAPGVFMALVSAFIVSRIALSVGSRAQ